jgi:hypothetical protein
VTDLRARIVERVLVSVSFARWSKTIWQLLHTKDQVVSVGILEKPCAGYTYVLILDKRKCISIGEPSTEVLKERQSLHCRDVLLEIEQRLINEVVTCICNWFSNWNSQGR